MATYHLLQHAFVTLMLYVIQILVQSSLSGEASQTSFVRLKFPLPSQCTFPYI